MSAPKFTSNYPNFKAGEPTLLSTPERTNASTAFNGSGVTIAFIDSGFYPHPDLDGRILVHADASTNHVVEQTSSFTTNDLSWHGQMTSVIACGDGKTSNGKYRGIASGANLVLVKVSTPAGHIKEADILRGIRWVIDTYQRFNVRVVNISVGGDFVYNKADHYLHKAIRKLTKAGVTVVVAAGNRHINYLLPPASAADAITVGGFDDHNSLDQSQWTIYQHNYGIVYDGTAKPELIAPANWLVSPIMPHSSVAREAYWLGQLLLKPTEQEIQHLLTEGYNDLGFQRDEINKDEGLYHKLETRIHAHKIVDTQHQHVDGTSVAAPIVTSVIAQMLQANPRLTPREIRAILTRTARRLVGVPSELQGAGVLNAAAAVQTAFETSNMK
ncbi:MAG: S8 family serine peptidase [Anaerolineaceae bacterium]|nr:S8 family serine peptidase [Anaerolineaceae bacterium]